MRAEFNVALQRMEQDPAFKERFGTIVDQVFEKLPAIDGSGYDDTPLLKAEVCSI